MQEFPLPDQRCLEAAEGWLGLGDYLSAEKELEELTPHLRAHPQVLSLRYMICHDASQWDRAADLAGTLVKRLPEDCENWVKWAFATRRKIGGSIVEAKGILTEAAAKFPAAFLIRYNLACYECQLGNLNEALRWLKQAFDLAGPMNVRSMALNDPDLEPLRNRISEI